MLRFIGKSTASAVLGLVIIGIGIEAYEFSRLWWNARPH